MSSDFQLTGNVVVDIEDSESRKITTKAVRHVGNSFGYLIIPYKLLELHGVVSHVSVLM